MSPSRSHRARFRPTVAALESRALQAGLAAAPPAGVAPAGLVRLAADGPATTRPVPQLVAPYRLPGTNQLQVVDYVGLSDLLANRAVVARAPVVFLGDSLTAFWAYDGQAAWGAHFNRFRAANLGIGSDLVQNVLWRVERGAVASQPRVAVLMAGVNNLLYTRDTPADTVSGIRAVVAAIQRQSPRTRVLVLGVLPTAHAGIESEIVETNARLAQAAGAGRYTFLNLGARLSSTPARAFTDGLHLSTASYHQLAPVIAQSIRRLLG